MADIVLNLFDKTQEIELKWNDTNSRLLFCIMEIKTNASIPKTLTISIDGEMILYLKVDQKGGFKKWLTQELNGGKTNGI